MNFIKDTNIFGQLKEMNITVLKRKHITRFEPNVDLEKKEQNNITKRVKNFEIKKIEPKIRGKQNIYGGMINVKNNPMYTIDLSSKLSDLTQKLEKFENQIKKLGKEFQL